MSRKRKPPKGKELKPRFFVFCEGKTEELYVKFLKALYRLPIEIDSKVAGNRITLKYIKNYEKTRFTIKKDKTFLLYDIDVPNMLEKLQGISDGVLLVSNPCIELWFLLHFKEQKAGIDCKTCIEILTRKNSSYRKTLFDKKLLETLEKSQLKAMHRAKKLNEFKNPSSTIYLFIEALDKVKNENT